MAEFRLLKIHPTDNVAVAITGLGAGTRVEVDDHELAVAGDIPAGHKVALEPLEPGGTVVKYGFPIGAATAAISRGEWVHSHNLRTCLDGRLEYRYEPRRSATAPADVVPTFRGYRRRNGRVGTRNEVWIINTVGCVNHAAERIAKGASERFAGKVGGVHAFTHPYGCSQLGDDLRNTQRVLSGLLRHPNAGGVLLLGLGCENNQMSDLLARAGDVEADRIRFFNAQDVLDEVEEGIGAVAALVARMEGDRREECPASDLLLGMKCGGSDGFSGLSANPLVGRIADRVTAVGGGALLTEVPEMFGAEQVLMERAANETVFREIVTMIDDFKEYFRSHGQPIYENPSPGNKAGGITTLEEKSLGAIQKGGRATVTAVVRYAEQAPAHGLTLVESPGNDGVSSTAMIASGATLLLFTTGRGTPLGFPVPTLKISSNSAIAAQKPHWIDFDAGPLIEGAADMQTLADQLFAQVLDVASGGTLANNEKHGYREIAVWKEGVTL
jgi:altronate hydrolase